MKGVGLFRNLLTPANYFYPLLTVFTPANYLQILHKTTYWLWKCHIWSTFKYNFLQQNWVILI